MKLAIKYRPSFIVARDVSEPTQTRLFYGIESNDGLGKGWVPCCEGNKALSYSSADERDQCLRRLRLSEFRERDSLHVAFALEMGRNHTPQYAV